MDTPAARHRLALAAASVVAITGLVGCGSDDEPTTTTVTVTASPSDPPTATPTTPTPTAVPNVSSRPVTYTEALDHIAAAISATGAPRALNRFQSPTGNIYCTIAEGGDGIPPSCELGEGKVDRPSVCPDSPTHFVGRVELADGAWQQICNSDTIRLPNPPTLGYGRVAQAVGGDVQCVSEQFGVTCVDVATQHGFFISRGTVDIVG